MKLTFQRPFKSIGYFSPIDLPDFVVLTGVNGAGKSHLLEAIENGAVQIDDLVQTKLNKPIRRFDWTNLVPQDTGAFAPYQITQERDQLWNQLTQSLRASSSELIETMRSLKRPELLSLTPAELRDLTVEKLIAIGITSAKAPNIVTQIKNAVSAANQTAISKFLQNENEKRGRFIELLKEKAGDSFITLEEEELYGHFPENWEPVDMFQQKFTRFFADYQRKWLNNKLRQLESAEDASVTFLEEADFVREHGKAPWDFVNDVLTTAGLEFRINRPAKFKDQPYEAILTDQLTSAQVRFGNLSSGEKILMSFAFCLYYAEDRRQMVDYPKVLLFDEIDAPLHPSMTQSLLRTIREVLIDGHKIKVVFATHSPSTVALSEAAALFAMYKTGERIKKTSKDEALAVLTAGVPTLSVDYENRRQIFVESYYDAQYYEAIYNKLRKQLVPKISLTFIPSGKGGEGNCDQVKEVVKQLQEGGSKSVYGIIDWDLANQESERVKVLGGGCRYSIDNFVLDPLLLGTFLLREKVLTREELGMMDAETFLALGDMDCVRLQVVADFIVGKIKARLPFKPTEEGRATCEYVGGKSIKLPVWFLRFQGHELEKAVKEAFPHLKRFTKESELKNAILAKVVDDVPNLIPREFLSVLKSIQNFPTGS